MTLVPSAAVGSQGILAIIELDLGHGTIGIDEGLLIDAPHHFDGADVVGVLTVQITRMSVSILPFDFTLGFG
jgi:hypothetical protein